ncbi:MAG TPA: hypothetical protein PL041_09320 [Melioribacteraceae bacterium]|nr:hypothetical protein [Melioribacteraceae bacterium]
MYCNNKNYLLDLYYNEGDTSYLIDIKNHVNNCDVCKKNYKEIENTIQTLNIIKKEKPNEIVFDNLIKTIKNTTPEIEQNIEGSPNMVKPIIEIVFSLIFILGFIYIISIKLSVSDIWGILKQNIYLNAVGPTGVAIILVLLLGTFLTLAISPVLLLSYKDKKKF